MKQIVLAAIALFAAAAARADEAPPLQPLVDVTPEGGVLRPPAGRYSGPVVLGKAMTLDGSGSVVVTGNDAGTVLTVNGAQITIAGLKIEHSGQRHEAGDACILLQNASFSIVKDNVLEDCLTGVDVERSDNNILRDNRILGGKGSEDMRGDGIRVWWSNDNRIEGNKVFAHRDVIFEYSTRNLLKGNEIEGGRYGTHFMYASGNVAEGNTYIEDSVGIFSMFSSDLRLVGNRILRSNGAVGKGIGLKEADNVTVENNLILDCAIGLYNDDSPSDPDRPNVIRGNRFAFNGIGVQYHRNQESNIFSRNDFVGNFTDVMVQDGGAATASQWDGNYWDDYQGFDRKHSGVGETPFEIYSYADKLWANTPLASFFRGSPALESLDFLLRLAPFSRPVLVLRDKQPATHSFDNDGAAAGG
ncbi:nitrous oxide reductase family maturation protein NosD [Rhodoblastus sp.]|uniref:nitrous oxide reductase family maturation protein NosD n=1 Tax=Rhodoblastus sp. TaxID=1962975 RepID=UPI00261ABE00|nr:nitrous oxide reductase family maturation protein NosD [Rhodoblastus sp.]